MEQRTDAYEQEEIQELMSGRKDSGQFLGWDHLKLIVRAVGGLLIRSPAAKLRGVTEARSLHVIVGNFDYKFGAQRLPG